MSFKQVNFLKAITNKITSILCGLQQSNAAHVNFWRKKWKLMKKSN